MFAANLTYLSSPWRPAALFDLPNDSSYQEQGQEAAKDRKEGRRGVDKEKKRLINVEEKQNSLANIWSPGVNKAHFLFIQRQRSIVNM